MLPRPALGAWGGASVALYAAFVTWSGLSIVWSIQGDRSWGYFNRDLAYLGFLLAGALFGALGPKAPRLFAGGLALLLAGVVVWALAGKVTPGLGPDVSRNARLRSPVGYWNALAILCDMAFLLALWVATPRARSHAVRAAGAVLAFASVVAVGLTLSRGGVAIGVLAVVAFLPLGGAVLETLAVAALAGLPALALLAWASTRPALVDGGASHAARVHDGWILGLLLVLGALAVAAAALALSRAEARRPLGPRRRRAVARGSAGAVAGAAAGVLLVLVVRAGGPTDWASARWHEFANPVPLVESPSRLSATSSNYRWTWWRQAWTTFEDHPAKGTGAGSFELAHRVDRTTYSPPAREPHELLLQVLSETGAIGFALFAAAFAAAAVAVAGTLRRLRGDARAAAAALVACLAAYVLHVLVDSGWDYVGVSGPALAILGVLLAAGAAPRAAGRQPLAALALLALAAVAISSLATPWLAERRVDAAYSALAGGDYERAATQAKRAHDLNPLALDALSVEAIAQELAGHKRAAWRTYFDATDLQPQNADTWFALGAFEVQVLHDCRYGYDHLNRSYTLDRFGPAGQPGTPLDKARAAVNRGRRRC